MGFENEESHEARIRRRLRVFYARQTHERQVFMQGLHSHRKKKAKKMLKAITTAVGPRWYQALSEPQRHALDTLESSIYQDLLEGRPRRTANVMFEYGLYPRPSYGDLMHCCYAGADDPKQMLAQLYIITYGYPVEGKRASYSLNARLMLSGILYLGLNNLIELLRIRFSPDAIDKARRIKPKPKPEPPLPSPYLQKMVAVPWLKHVYKRPPPPPLPNLEDLNAPYEDPPIIIKPIPPPPPPPPAKKTIPREVCDAMAGYHRLEPHVPSDTGLDIRRKPIKLSHRRARASKGSIDKRALGGTGAKQKKGFRKPTAPSVGMSNAQFTIQGIFQVHGRAVYVLGNVSILPAQGDMIHGGFAFVNNQYITINRGYRGALPPPKPDPCDCVKVWNKTVMEYVKNSKCYCCHHYDYGNEGTFPPDELPYFNKPTGHLPMTFNYDTIYDLDPKHHQVEKDFKKIWDTDSVLHSDDGKQPVVKEVKKKKKEISSHTCLGPVPKPEDYLKCALRFMRNVNLAACLPDIHLVPELKEWMRRRMYGPLNTQEKEMLLRKSNTNWQILKLLAEKGYGHVSTPRDPELYGHDSWLNKQRLNDKFRRYTAAYKVSMFRSQAHVTNLFWRTMYQAEVPDKKFREIYFSYLYSRLQDLHLIAPYNPKETVERKNVISKRRYICLPAGVEDLEV